eukprot:TRINITY_DN14936_c0_g1_i2.p4 TRINITY_DN14936_c0_g1~~TRINITY_DN14936_c0_g1_i2.p4  ORF type:complete len:211 (+),score=20.35 TRINITY_DN14936_c0_g1_i2:471-1103(+)
MEMLGEEDMRTVKLLFALVLICSTNLFANAPQAEPFSVLQSQISILRDTRLELSQFADELESGLELIDQQSETARSDGVAETGALCSGAAAFSGTVFTGIMLLACGISSVTAGMSASGKGVELIRSSKALGDRADEVEELLREVNALEVEATELYERASFLERVNRIDLVTAEIELFIHRMEALEKRYSSLEASIINAADCPGPACPFDR